MFETILPYDEHKLMADGLLSPPDDQGFRKLHKRLLHKLSNKEYSDLPLDVLHDSPNWEHSFSRIPSNLLSPAAMEYLGFKAETASWLFRMWTSVDTLQLMGFWTIALRQIRIDRHAPRVHGHMPSRLWRGVMDRIGISDTLQDDLLGVEWEAHWKQEKDLMTLLEQTILMRIVALEAILYRSWERVAAASRGRTEDSDGEAFYPQNAARARGAQLSLLSRNQDLRFDVALPRRDEKEGKKIARLLADADGSSSVRIYRMANLSEIQERLNVPTLNLVTLQLLGTSSFTAASRLLLYSHLDYVHDCISYAKHRAPDLPALLVQQDVPLNRLALLPPWDHYDAQWPGPLWRTLVLDASDWRFGINHMPVEGHAPGSVLIRGEKAMRWPVLSFQCLRRDWCDASKFRFNQGQAGNVIEYSWSLGDGWDLLEDHAGLEISLVTHERHSQSPLDWGHDRIRFHIDDESVERFFS